MLYIKKKKFLIQFATIVKHQQISFYNLKLI